MFPEKCPVDSASYALAMAMRPIYVSICFFGFSLGFGNMVARLTLTIAVVQRLKCKSKFNKELLTTGHDHGRIRKNTFDRLMGFASVLKVFVCVLSAKLVVDSCLFRICSIFSGVFCRHLSWKQTCGNQTQWKHL